MLTKWRKESDPSPIKAAGNFYFQGLSHIKLRIKELRISINFSFSRILENVKRYKVGLLKLVTYVYNTFFILD